MEGANMTPVGLTEEAYDILFSYLSAEAVANLSRVEPVTRDDYYWLPKLIELLVEWGGPVDTKEDLFLNSVPAEDLYKTLKRLEPTDHLETLVDFLVGKIVHVEAEDSLLIYALRNNILTVVRYITGYEFKDDIDYQKVLEYAIEALLEDSALEIMYEHPDEINVSYNNNEAVSTAIMGNMMRLLNQLLLDDNVKHVGLKRNVLQAVVNSGDLAIVKILVHSGLLSSEDIEAVSRNAPDDMKEVMVGG